VRTSWVGLVLGLAALLMLASASGREYSIQLSLTEQELEWVGQQVFRNECAGRRECLVHWNRGEAFPSLGIGHFIWYPEGVSGPFVESFPTLIRHMQGRSAAVPEWLNKTPVPGAPWADRAQFLASADSNRIAALRAFLADTKGEQAAFIVGRARESLEKIIAAAPSARQASIRQQLEALSKTPGGTYAVIDYVNFKGEGLSPTERYEGQGWGLLQVLLAMSDSADSPVLPRFRAAAAEVLTRRAHNADKPIERERWLPGWLKRLETYREPGESGG
jgi:hypothetical protein